MKKYLYALDLSLTCSGMTIFNLETLEPVKIMSFPTKSKWSRSEKLKFIGDNIRSYMKLYEPNELVIEKSFYRHNTASEALNNVQGMIMYIFEGIEPEFYAPTTIKAQILKGNASKELIRKLIENKYPNIIFNNEDESDSFAVGLTHLIKKGLIKWDKKITK